MKQKNFLSNSRGGKSAKKVPFADVLLLKASTLSNIFNFTKFKHALAMQIADSCFFILAASKCESNIFFSRRECK